MNIKKLIKGYAINIPDEVINKLPKQELKNIKYIKDFENCIYSGLENHKIYVKQFIFADTNYNDENSLEKLDTELKQRFKDIDIYKNALFVAGVYK